MVQECSSNGLRIIPQPSVRQSAFYLDITEQTGYWSPALQTYADTRNGVGIVGHQQMSATQFGIDGTVIERMNTGCNIHHIEPHMGIQFAEIACRFYFRRRNRTLRTANATGQYNAEVVVKPSVWTSSRFDDAGRQVAAIRM